MNLESAGGGAFSHTSPVADPAGSMPGRVLVELKELAFDCSHPCHEPVEFHKETLLVLLGLVDRIGG